MSGIDTELLLWINQGWAHPWLDGFFIWISERETFSLPLIGLLLMVSSWRFGRRGLLLWLTLVVLVIGSDRLGNVLKNTFEEPRPCYTMAGELREPGQGGAQPCGPSAKGMPSNHALNFFTMAAFMSLFLRGWGWRGTLFGISILVAISRIYLAKHYPSQVVVGSGLGLLLGFAAAWLGIRFLPYLKGIHTTAIEQQAARRGEA